MGPPGRGRKRRVGRADQDGLLPSRTQRYGSRSLRLRGEANAYPGGRDAGRHRQTPQAGPLGSGHQRRRASDLVFQLYQPNRRRIGRGPRARYVTESSPPPFCPAVASLPASSPRLIPHRWVGHEHWVHKFRFVAERATILPLLLRVPTCVCIGGGGGVSCVTVDSE